MPGWAFWIIAAMLGAIVYLTATSVGRKDARERHHDEMIAEYGGVKTPIEHRENCYAITFIYRGGTFTFEDIEDFAAGQKVYRGYLRLKTSLHVNLGFTEHMRSEIRSSPASLSGGHSIHGSDQVMIPPEFKEYGIYSNNVRLANALLEDEGVVRIMAKYKNRDSRGKPAMTLEIIDGQIIVRFSAVGDLQPGMFDLRHNPSSIDRHLENILVIARRMEKIAQQEKEQE
ncbi:MAG: hypothetical protein ACLFPX_03605 [Candidatus Omnitrophota bacterium]